jgi:hypothetical protein
MTSNGFESFDMANCESMMQALILFIDNELSDVNEAQALQLHLQQCPPCQVEMEHESRVINQLKNLLAASCCESAPEELNRRIAAQTALLAAQMSNPTQVITEYRRTETTINGETLIEIQTTHEIRRDFPLS